MIKDWVSGLRVVGIEVNPEEKKKMNFDRMLDAHADLT
jgi:hypothetical protein